MHYVLKTLNLLLFCLNGIHYFLYFILSLNLFLSNLLTKNEDLTSEAELSNSSKGNCKMQSCGAVWAVNLLSKGDASDDFFCACAMDFVYEEWRL